ncbi:hypothetical protein C3L33_21299, partial [Rhododendron williamsianum]
MADPVAITSAGAALASAVGTLVQAWYQRKAFWDPRKEKDDLSGNVEEIIVDLNEASRKLGCIRLDFDNEIEEILDLLGSSKVKKIGHEINADYLLECWAAENLLGGDDSITTELLKCGHHVLSHLQYVSLLEKALDIVGSGINNIPPQIENLTKLRRLRVSFSASQNENATQEVNFNYEVISKLSILEELVINVKSPEIWSDDVEENIMKEVATLKEFKSLKFCFPDKVVNVVEVGGSQNQNLRIRVPDATTLLSFIEGSSWSKVQDIENFEFYIGCKRSEQPHLPNFDEFEKYVKYSEVGGRNLTILKVLAEAAAFELVDNKNIKQLSDEELESMNGSIQQLCEIQCLKIEKCDEIVEIISTSESGGILLPKLKKMVLLDMEKLKSICASETLNWPSLKGLGIFKCPSLLKLPFTKDNAKILKRIVADPEWWGKLQFDQNNENKEWLQKLRKLG